MHSILTRLRKSHFTNHFKLSASFVLALFCFCTIFSVAKAEEVANNTTETNSNEPVQTVSGTELTNQTKTVDNQVSDSETSLAPEASMSMSQSISTQSGSVYITDSGNLNSSPDVDAQTGAYMQDYKIDIPPGRSGLQYDLSLTYNSNYRDADNVFGYGWRVPIQKIERLNKLGVDKMYSRNDFESTLDGELTSVNNTDFYPKIEKGNFNKYTFSGNKWVIYDKSGTRYTFGSTTTSRFFDSASSSKVFAWYLDEIRDTNNNYIKFVYEKDGNQIYLSSIIYTGNGVIDGINNIKFNRQVRNDVFVSNKAGFTATTSQRISNIEVTIDGLLNRRYQMEYGVGENGNRSILKSVSVIAFDDQGALTLPSTKFEYSNLSPAAQAWSTTSTSSIPEMITYGHNSVDLGVRFFDVNGDGYADLTIYKNDTFQALDESQITKKIYLNKGSSWELDSNWTFPSPAYKMAFTGMEFGGYWIDTGARMADVNADGYTDILWAFDRCINGWTCHNFQKTYINNKVNGWSESTTTWLLPNDVYFSVQSNTSNQAGNELVDVNGDGLVDIVKSNRYTTNGGGSYTYTKKTYLNNGQGWTEAADVWDLPEVIESQSKDAGTRFVDLNNDGLVDLLRHVDADFSDPAHNDTPVDTAYLNTGNGWNLAPTWNSPLHFVYRFYNYAQHTRSTRLIDVNGDGLSDIYADDTDDVVGNLRGVFINTGNGWSDQTANWDFTSSFLLGYTYSNNGHWASDPGVRFVDFDGDNMVDIVKGGATSNNYPNNPTYTNEVRVHKGDVPDLLTKIQYPQGGTTTVTYNQSARYKNGTTLANSSISSNLDVVAKTENSTSGGTAVVSDFYYADGHYHYSSTTQRQFAGFGRVSVSNGLGTTTNYYHQGNSNATATNEVGDDYAKIGSAYKTEIFDLAGNLYQSTSNIFSTSTANTGSTFVKLDQTTQRDYDGDGDKKDKAVSYTYNSTNGNLSAKMEWGEVTANADGTFTDTGSDKQTTIYTYATNTTANIIGLPSSERVDNQLGAKVKESRYYYDTQALGSVTKGNLTKKEDWATSSTYVSAQSSYNLFGLKTQDVDQRGNITSYAYDWYNLYPASTSNALFQNTRFTYDYSSGKPKTTIDSNGYSHEHVYDSLDRLVEVKEPRGTNGALVTVEKNTYTDTPGNISIQNKKYLDSVQTIEGYTYLDGFGRKVQTRQEAENANQYTVSDVVYDKNGNVAKESLPYFSNGSGRTNATNQANLYTNYAYDALGRKLAVGTVVGTTTYVYDQWQETVTDPLNNQKKFQYDAYGQLTNVQEINGTSTYTTTYVWTPHSQLEKITDALGNTRNFSYDGLGRRTRAEDLHATGDSTFGVWQYVYDAAGNLGTTTDPKNQVTVVSYDALNRPVSENFTGQAGIEATYVYDICTNGKGLLCTTVSPAASTTRQYNSAGVVASEQKAIGTTTFSHSYLYNRQNNQTELTYPDNSVVRYTYNTAGQLDKVEQKEAAGTYRDIISNFNYGPHGMVTYQLHGNGASTTKTYDQNALYRLKNILTTATNPIGGGGEELRMLELGNLSEGEMQQILSEDLTTRVEETTPAMPGDIISEPMPLLVEDAMVVEDIKAASTTIATSTLPIDAVIEPGIEVLPIEVKEVPAFKDTAFTPKHGSDNKPTENSILYQFTSESKGNEKVQVDLNKFMPEVRFKKWDNKVDFSLSYLDVSGAAAYSTEKNIVQWQDEKTTKMVEAYPLKPAVGMEDGGFEIEVVLMEKPESNVFPFYINGYEGLDFFYQPALDQEKQDDPNIVSCSATVCVDKEGNPVLERAENIVGSYAVYAKDSNDGTGKVGHIYRPKVVDANGNEVWADMTYYEGLLEIVVPEDFLAKATYPVRVDPTFGYNVVGGSTVLGVAADHVFGNSIQATTPATIDSISVYVEGANTAIKGLVTNSTLNLLSNGVSPATAVASTSYTWQTMTYASGSKPVLTTAGTYYLGVIVASSSPWLRYRFDTVGTTDTRIHDTSNSFTTPTSPTDATLFTPRRASIFATYTVTNPTNPTAPTSLLTESAINPTTVTDDTPEFSAIFGDPTNTDVAVAYQIQVATTSSFSSIYWDSNKETLSSTTPVGQRSPDISYGGAALQPQTDYYWRIRFYDNTDTEGSWSTSTANFRLGSSIPTSGYVLYGDSVASGWTLVPHNSTTTISTTVVNSGTNAIQVDFNGPTYTDFNFTATAPFNQNTNQYLDLYYKTNNPDGYYIWVYFLDYPNYSAYGCCHLGDYVVGGFATGTWNHVQIPLSAFGTTTVPMKELVFTTDYNLTAHFDDIRFTGTTTAPSGSTFVPVLQNLTYTYDAVGNITQIVDSSGTRGAATTTYTYDNLYRLTSASTTGTTIAPFKETYTYNAVGNLLSKTGTGSYTYAGNTGTNYANPHAATTINGVTYNYDQNGNLASTSASLTNIWDYRNRLGTTTKSGITTAYLYDVNEQRVQKTVGTITTRYPSTLYETVGTSTTKHIYANGVLISSIDGIGSTTARTYHNHQDHLGSTNIVSTDIGYLDHLYSYLPYGATRLDEGTYNQSNQFIGQNRDVEADLSYLNARYYDGMRGQFISQDPVFRAIGNPPEIQRLTKVDLNKVLMDPQALNSYNYARNNPIRYSDPDGLWFKEFATGQQSFSDFRVEVGQATQYMTDNSPAWNYAVSNPMKAGLAVGVTSAAAAVPASAAVINLATIQAGVGIGYVGKMAVGATAYGYVAKNALQSTPEMTTAYSQFKTSDTSTWKSPVYKTATLYGPGSLNAHAGAIYDLYDSILNLAKDLGLKVNNTKESNQKSTNTKEK